MRLQFSLHSRDLLRDFTITFLPCHSKLLIHYSFLAFCPCTSLTCASTFCTHRPRIFCLKSSTSFSLPGDKLLRVGVSPARARRASSFTSHAQLRLQVVQLLVALVELTTAIRRRHSRQPRPRSPSSAPCVMHPPQPALTAPRPAPSPRYYLACSLISLSLLTTTAHYHASHCLLSLFTTF